MKKIFSTTKFPQLSRNGGFSLLEMLIYIGILVFLLVIIMNIVVSISISQRSINAQRSIENSIILSLERISREVRQADAVNEISSVLGVYPGHLVLGTVDNNGNPRTVEFYLSDGRIMMMENGVLLGAISQSDSRVTNLVFHLFSDSDVYGVRTEIGIESGTGKHYRANNFYSSTIIR